MLNIIPITRKLTLQLVSTCSRLVPNLFSVAHKSARKGSFALNRGEMKEKNLDALHAIMDILKTGLGIMSTLIKYLRSG